MKMTSVKKVQFTSLNDKRYYFSGGIVSLPFGPPTLSSIRNLNKSYPKTHSVIKKERGRLLKLKNQIVAKSERPRVLRSISSQPIT